MAQVRTGEAAGDGSSADKNDFVTLVSSDGFEFIVRREAAMVSGMIKRVLDPRNHGGFIETTTNKVSFEGEDGLDGVVLEKVCEYMYYNERNKNCRDVPHIEIPRELCLQLLIAADYLEL